MQKILALFAVICVFSLSTYAQVKAPNYDFSLQTIDQFTPGKSLKVILKKYPKTQVLKAGELFKTYISHDVYRFPIFFKTEGELVQSSFARLPTFFLHDLFHRDLIKRYGKQDLYKKVDRAAIYVWKNEKGLKVTYKGECTITCFPSYLSFEKKETKGIGLLNEILLF